MRSFQFALHRSWGRLDPEALVRWSPEIRQDLLWWLDRERLEQVSPQLDLWSDASDVGWGAHLGEEVVSGLWSPEEQLSSVSLRELLAIFFALQHFLPVVQNATVVVYADNSTVLAYLRNLGHQIRGLELGGSGSSALGGAPCHLPSASIHHVAQHRVGRFSFSSTSDSGFRVAMVSGAIGTGSGRSGGSASGQGSVEPASCSSSALGSVKASSSCLETIQRFVRSCGFSWHVAKQAAMARRTSFRAGYQAKWTIYWQ